MNEVTRKIVEEIGLRGAIPFARFMELALYCPVYGYYEKEGDTPGRQGDFYTSVSVGSLFGQLLACQFAEWLGRGPASKIQAPVSIVEAGAHDGRLAMDILNWMREQRPALAERLAYVLVEPSDRRRLWQERTLAGCGNTVRWVKSVEELAGVRGVIFCNELLDALPLHRLGWDAKARTWFEWGVTLDADRFVWTRMAEVESTVHSPQPSDLSDRSDNASTLQPFILGLELAAVLPDGFIVEICPAAVEWWRQAAGALESGRLVAIDYGLTAEELFIPERAAGTLRAYHQHHVTRDVLARPGEQDLTAHVNFTALQAAGEQAGLRTEDSVGQAQFLTRIAARVWQGECGFGAWTPAHTRQFQALTHPEHLGRAFRVLVQTRPTVA